MSLLMDLSGEVLDWTAGNRERDERLDDVTGEVWAFALSTFVDGDAVTPRGYDVTDQFEEVGEA